MYLQQLLLLFVMGRGSRRSDEDNGLHSVNPLHAACFEAKKQDNIFLTLKAGGLGVQNLSVNRSRRNDEDNRHL